MRFAIEVYEAIRKVWSDHKPLGMRISATDWVEGGWTLDDGVELAKELKKRGCDYITASSGGSVPEQQLKVGPGYQVPFPKKFGTNPASRQWRSVSLPRRVRPKRSLPAAKPTWSRSVAACCSSTLALARRDGIG
jgi:hypothetical protein